MTRRFLLIASCAALAGSAAGADPFPPTRPVVAAPTRPVVAAPTRPVVAPSPRPVAAPTRPVAAPATSWPAVAPATSEPTVSAMPRPSEIPVARPVVLPCPPACTVTPQKVVVHRTAYGTRCETFCLRSVSLAGFFRKLCGEECGPVGCDPPRSKTRLVKWDVTEERVQLKCTVEPPPPVLAPGPAVPPRPVTASPFIVITPKK